MTRLTAKMLGLAMAVAIAFGGFVGPAAAQGTGPINQMQLTENLIKGFIAAQKDLAPLSDELQKAAESGNITPGLQSKLDAVAKKNGFKTLTELDDVTDNINMIMSGIDPQSGEFKMSTDEIRASIKEEIEEIKKDTTIPKAEKDQLLAEQEAALKTAGQVQFPTNIELVKKYRKQIEDALQ